MEFNQILQKTQQRKSNFCKSYFDISKYARMEKVLVCRNMLRYDHMDECGIGTDCKCETGETICQFCHALKVCKFCNALEVSSPYCRGFYLAFIETEYII